MGTVNRKHPVMIHGWQKLGTVNTVVSLDSGASSELIKSIIVRAQLGNSSQILFGSSETIASSQAKGLDASQELVFPPGGENIRPFRLQDLYINGGSSSDGVDWWAIKG